MNIDEFFEIHDLNSFHKTHISCHAGSGRGSFLPMTTLSPHPALAPAALALPLALGLHERIAANGLDGSLTQLGAGMQLHCMVQCRDVRRSNQPTRGCCCICSY